MARSALGIDIGSHAVHVAEARRGRDGHEITNFGGVDLPEGAVREGEILDVETVTKTLQSVVGSADIREKKAWIGVANKRVVVRQVDLPWMPEEELAESLQFQAQEHIPMPVEDAELDFHVLEELESGGEGDEDLRMMRVLLVAAQKGMVANHVQAVTDAGLRPQGVDLNPFALIRAIGGESIVEHGSEVLVDVGGGVSNIVIHTAGVPEFVRILVQGGQDITDVVQRRHDLSREEAEATKRRVGFRSDPDDDIARTIAEEARDFIGEIRSSIDYYQAQTGGTQLTRVRLAGGGSQLVGLVEALADAVRLPVEVVDPFARFPATDTVHGPDELAVVSPTLVTAVGLAVGGLE